MKKLFIITLAVLFAAGAAYAVEYDYSGMINTRGTYLDNDDGISEKDAYMWYDMEFDSTLKINPTDQSQIYLNWEIHDENFTGSPQSSGGKTGDDNIAFKRAFGKYTWANGINTSFGLMSGGAFGTAFGDNGDGYYRVRVDGAASFGNWGFILEKVQENGTGTTDDWEAEKDDSDAYAAYLVTKAGDVTLNFLAKYAQIGDATGANVAPGGFEEEGADIDMMIFVAAAMGSFGNIGFEAEVDIVDYSFDGNDIGPIEVKEDYTSYGLYGNVWMTMDAAKFGGYAAYGSWDDDAGAGYDFGADFYFGEGIGENLGVGSNNRGGFSAVTLLGLYADYSINDALSINGNFSYWMSNEDELADGTDSDWKDADGYELTGRGSYQLADNVKYSVGAAWGELKPDEGSSPDAYVRAFHKIQINF